VEALEGGIALAARRCSLLTLTLAEG